MVSEIDDYLPGDSRPRRELDLAELRDRLASHKRWLIGPALLCFVLSAIVVNVIPPRYTAETKVLVESQESYFTRIGSADTQQQPLPDDEAVQSQVQLVTSRDVARDAIKQLSLQGNPEFDPLANGVGPVTRMLVMLGLARDPLRVSPEERILTTYFDRLSVFPVTKSRVLTIEFESQNPDLAAKAANTIAGLYIGVQSAAKREAAHAAAESLRTTVANLRAKSADAEAQAQAFRTQSGLTLGTNNATLSSQQLTDLSTQLSQARSAEADAQAKSKLIRDMVKSGRAADVNDVASDDLIKRLSEQRAAVQADLAVQSRTLLPGHPRMQELTAQLGDLDRQLRVAAERTMRNLDNDARVAQSRVANLTAAINAQKDAVGAAGPDQIKLNEFDLNARLLKDQLEFNTSKYQEALSRENEGSTPADARIISRAVAPQLPTFPKKLPIIAIMTIAGALLSLGLLIARELLSGRAFVRPQPNLDLPISLGEQRRAVPVADRDLAFVSTLGLKPSLAPETPIGRQPADEPEPIDHEAEAVAETMAKLLADLTALTRPDQALRIMILDGGPAALSDVVTARLGRALSRTYRTIAVDLAWKARWDDPRTEPDGEAIAADDLPGLRELLQGNVSFAEVIHRDTSSRLHFIAAGVAEVEPGGDEEGVSNVLDALAETYDVVLMSGLEASDDDSPAIAAEHADALVFTIDHEMTDDARDLLFARFDVNREHGPDGFVVRLPSHGRPDVSRGVAA